MALLRGGMLCRGCSQKKCAEDVDQGFEIECPLCAGDGCDECENGYLLLKGCPNDLCRDFAAALPIIDLMEKGIMPVAGGSLDQSAWLIDAARQYRNDMVLVENERRR